MSGSSGISGAGAATAENGGLAARYRARRAELAADLARRGVAAARFEDFEHMRSPSVRYLCGHPGDAFLIVGADGRSALVAWDVNMAALHAHADVVLAYTDFGRRSGPAMRAALEAIGVPAGSRVEMPRATPYPSFVDHVEALEDFDLLCLNDGADKTLLAMRARKDDAELEIYRRISALTDALIDRVEEGVRSGEIRTELDAAMLIERASRSDGCEGTGFHTIAAGPTRSFGIHAFPSFGSGPFATPGMSILDFGIVLEGYTSDVTMSFLRGPLTARQEEMAALVREAYDIGAGTCAPGVPAKEVALRVDRFFASRGFTMPHALGHGIGMESHEYPGINLRDENDAVLETGHIVTMEPGLYDPALGGVRLENDLLITATGFETLTKSRIVRL